MNVSSNRFTAVIMGKSGSGKDTAGKLLEAKGYDRITTHTSRPMRTGEINGVSYHFHTQDEFEQLRDEGYFAESRDYDALFGHCSYGTSKESLITEGKKYIILTPEGYNSLVEAGIDCLIPVYMRTTPTELKRRLMKRVENETDPKTIKTLTDEIDRRLETDRMDFMDVDAVAAGICSGFEGLVVIDTDGLTPEEVANKIDRSIKETVKANNRLLKTPGAVFSCYVTGKDGYDISDAPADGSMKTIAAYRCNGYTAAISFKNGFVQAFVYDNTKTGTEFEDSADLPVYTTNVSAQSMSYAEIKEFLSGCIDRYAEVCQEAKQSREIGIEEQTSDCECL